MGGSTYAGGRRGKERGAKRSSDWRREGGQPPDPEHDRNTSCNTWIRLLLKPALGGLR